jgi:hypothetical protein
MCYVIKFLTIDTFMFYPYVLTIDGSMCPMAGHWSSLPMCSFLSIIQKVMDIYIYQSAFIHKFLNTLPSNCVCLLLLLLFYIYIEDLMIKY